MENSEAQVQELSGFFSPERSGEWVEIVTFWNGQLWDVEHRPAGQVSPACRELAATAGGYSDTADHMTYWFREASAPVPMASDPRGIVGMFSVAALIPFFIGVILIAASVLTSGPGARTNTIAFGFEPPSIGPIAIREGSAGTTDAEPPASGGSLQSYESFERPSGKSAGMLGVLQALDFQPGYDGGLDAELEGLISGGNADGLGGVRLTAGGRRDGLITSGGSGWGTCTDIPCLHAARSSSALGFEKGDASIGIGGDDVLATGQYDKRLINTVIMRHLAQIQYCYERELLSDEMWGKTVIKFTIANEGGVLHADVSSSTMSAKNAKRFHACVVEVFEKMKFPAPGHTVIVNYPLIFNIAGT